MPSIQSTTLIPVTQIFTSTTMKTFFASVLSSLFALMVLAGCSQSDGLAGLYQLDGTVTLNGSPVANATLTFHPVETGDGVRHATAGTDSDGRYRATTLNPGDGIFPGEYRVTIVQIVETGEVRQYIDEDGNRQEDRIIANALPARYSNPATSNLSVTVERRRNTQDFTLE